MLPITDYHAKYFAYDLTRRHVANSVDRLSQLLFDVSVDLNLHQIEPEFLRCMFAVEGV
jgi:hypothetical protein